MSEKSLKELGEEYVEYMNLNEENIKSCKTKIKKAKENGDGLALLDLQKSLAVLYEISRELKKTSEHLINYYS